MIRLLVVISGVMCFFHCTGEDLQEAISGCQIEEGKATCIDLEAKCKAGFSRWEDPEAADGVKCQCCEGRE